MIRALTLLVVVGAFLLLLNGLKRRRGRSSLSAQDGSNPSWGSGAAASSGQGGTHHPHGHDGSSGGHSGFDGGHSSDGGGGH